MNRLMKVAACLLLVPATGHYATGDDEPSGPPSLVPVGAARLDITPDYPVRLSGYGSRRKESEGIAQRLWTRALAIGADEGDGPAVLVTVENCGMTPSIADHVAQRLSEQAGIQRERLAIAVSHSHTAPCLTNWAPYIFGTDIPGPHQEHIDRYTRELENKMTQVALDALASRRPARLLWGQGNVGFAANRRVLRDGRWTGFGVQPDGPVDHSLPILVAQAPDGKPIAIVANYACHCTTLGGDFNRIAGDWAGYAVEFIEQDHPGAVALITIGCGADANPEPRGQFDQCRDHGRSLADEVRRLTSGHLTPIIPKLECRQIHIDLPFDTLPTQPQWEEQTRQGGAAAYRAQQFLHRLSQGETLPTTLTYPVASWTFGDDLAMVFLGGEVVVDYAMRLKTELDADRLWITAYANDVPCYIPSRRILREGGYEADFSMIYYARPNRFAEDVEDMIIGAVKQLLPPAFATP